MKFLTQITQFLSNRRGATAIEYGLIAAGIALVIFTSIGFIGTNLNSVYNKVGTSLAADDGGGMAIFVGDGPGGGGGMCADYDEDGNLIVHAC